MAEESKDEVREYARAQIKKKRDFKTYLFVYAAVTLVVVGVWFITSPTAYFWHGHWCNFCWSGCLRSVLS